MSAPVVDGDALNYAIATGGRQILAHCAEHGEWDQMPALFVVAHSGPLPRESVPAEVVERASADLDLDLAAVAAMTGLRLVFEPWPVPEALWEMTDPAGMIEALALVMNSPGAPQPPLDVLVDDELRVLGLLLVVEAWSVRVDRPTSAPIVPGELDSHPDRIEVRVVSGVDTAGYAYTLAQPRGSDNVNEQILTLGDDRRDAGAVPRALAELLDALSENIDDEVIS